MTTSFDTDIAHASIACLDLTALGEETDASIASLCDRALTPHGPVAAICTWAEYVPAASKHLAGKVPIATVVNFPEATDAADKVASDAAAAVAAGANEIDVVAPWHKLLAGDEAGYIEILDAARHGTGDAQLKVIIESGELKNAAAIARAAELSVEHGADFVKTSTGKTAVSATPEAADTILGVLARSDRKVGFKASGGVRTLDDAKIYHALVIKHLGEAAATPARYRIGASSLLDALLKALDA